MIRRVLAVAAVATSLAACATVRPPATAPAVAGREPLPTPAPLAIAPPYRTSVTFAALPGWSEDDHAAAFGAFAAGCSAAHDPALADTCREARGEGRLGETDARQFLETHF